jgi:hypothetical protein
MRILFCEFCRCRKVVTDETVVWIMCSKCTGLLMLRWMNLCARLIGEGIPIDDIEVVRKRP